MTAASECRAIRQALGVYVIGAIEPAERAQVDEHLATCPECREELAGLAGLPAFLHRVPVAEAQRLAAGTGEPAAPPPDAMLDSLLARAARVRRVRRWRTVAAAAAAAVVVLGGGTAGVLAAQGGGTAPQSAASWQRVSATSPQTTAAVTVRYSPRAWGTAMAVRVSGIPSGTVCELRVTDASGRTTVAGSWRVTYRAPGAWYPTATSLPEGSLRSFQVTAGGRVLASLPARE